MGKNRQLHNFKRRLKLIEKQTGKPWSPGTKKTHDGNVGWWEKAGGWNDAPAWGQSHLSKGTWSGTRKFSKRDQKAAKQKTDGPLPMTAEEKKAKKKMKRQAKIAQAKLRNQELSKTGDASANERPKLGVGLTKNVRRKKKRSKRGAQTDIQTYTDTGAAGPVSLDDVGLSEATVKKKKTKKQKMGTKRGLGTCSSAATNEPCSSDIGRQMATKSRASRASSKTAVGTEESKVALESSNHAISTLPGSEPKKATKRHRLRNLLLEEARKREKFSGRTGQVGGEPDGKRKKVKLKTVKVKLKTKGAEGKRKLLRNGASIGSLLRNASGRPLSKKERLRAKLGIQTRMKQKACVICPGSITDRFAQQQLNFRERRLLATGGLSWRWLRDPFDPERLPGASRHKPDSRAHQVKLDKHLQHLPELAARKLCWLDECLETFAYWPPCTARAALAVRLRTKGALRKHCERYFAEVIEPLIQAPTSKAIATDRPGEGATLQMSLLVEARRLCTVCSEAWRSLTVDGLVQLEGSGNDVRSAWWQMLCCAISSDLAPRCKGPRSAWLRALQHAVFARFCPEPTSEVRQKMLQVVAEAAGKNVVKSTAEAQLLPLVLLPLGTFTFWQVLLLAATTHWLGTGATVLRRTAAGPPEVVWRSSAHEPPVAAGKTTEALP